MQNKVRLISITPGAEDTMAYCARVSSSHQNNLNIAGLLSYCARNEHWSVFEMANMVLEINTTRMISPQILRHRSFNFQEFSQRYAEAYSFETIEARRQDLKNRQNSIDDLDPADKSWFERMQLETWIEAQAAYEEALKRGIAKECARALLPLNTSTKLYMNGTIRSWIHYINLRTESGTQVEHRRIAEACKTIFKEQLPLVAKALNW